MDRSAIMLKKNEWVMKKYLITLLLMVMCCENRLQGLYNRSRLIDDLRGIPEREMQKMWDETNKLLQEHRRQREIEEQLQKLCDKKSMENKQVFQ